MLAPWRLPPSWDESIYLSQVAQGPSLPFAASRARGITILVAPWVGSGVPLTALRVVLVIAAAAAITGAFVPWIRLIGKGAVWAAALFASGWVTLSYGSAVMPNLWVAALGVAAVGAAISAIDRPERRTFITAAALVGAMAAFRPFDAVAIVTPLLVFVVVRRAWILAGAVLAGVAVGVAPWVAEMTVRFGSVREGVDAAGDMGRIGGADPLDTVRTHLALADGSPLGASGPVSTMTSLWLAAVVVSTAVGFALAPTWRVRRPLAVALASAALPAAGYLVFVRGAAPRFLLPTFALLSLPMGAALAAALARPALRAVAVAVSLLWVGSHLGTALEVTSTAVVERAAPQTTGRELGRLVGTDDCVVLGRSWPQVAYAAGCAGVQDTVDPMVAARAAAAAGDRLFVVTGSGASLPPLAVRPLFSAVGLDVYEVVPSDGAGAVP